MEIKPNEKIRVRLESFNQEILKKSCNKLIDLIHTFNIKNKNIKRL